MPKSNPNIVKLVYSSTTETEAGTSAWFGLAETYLISFSQVVHPLRPPFLHINDNLLPVWLKVQMNQLTKDGGSDG